VLLFLVHAIKHLFIKQERTHDPVKL
jgi:hypothetical protein